MAAIWDLAEGESDDGETRWLSFSFLNIDGSEATDLGEADYSVVHESGGGCTVALTNKVTGERARWWLFIWAKWTTKATTSVISTIDCEGQFSTTFSHFGGLGPRAATTTMKTTEATAAGSTIYLEETDERKSCTYLNLVLTQERCVTEHAGEFSFHEVLDGEVTSIQLCSEYRIQNEPTLPLSGFLGVVDAEIPRCFDPTVDANLAAALAGLSL